MNAGPDPILRLLGSISDGTEIDWERAERECRGVDERRLLRALRVVAGVSEFHGRPAGPEVLGPGDPFGHLVIRERLGAGSWGQVFRAEDTKLRREVALKIIFRGGTERLASSREAGADPKADRTAEDARYLEEARRLASIRHPNVVTIYSIEQADETAGFAGAALVLEYVPGRSLAEVVASEGRRGAAEVIAIGVELCRALAAVHCAGLVHRDVKAQNAMREDGGRIVLMDFGPVGATPLYMAPELFRGAAPTPQSDLYSLGVLLYHLATGSFPVSGDSVGDLREAHARGGGVPLRDVRPDLAADLVRVLDRALAPEPEDRYATAGEMERALSSCLQASAKAGRDRRPADSRDLRRRPRRLRIALGGLLGALAIVAALVLYRGGHKRLPPPEAGSGDSYLSSAVESVVPAYTIEAGVWRGRRQRIGLREGDRVSPGDSISLSLRATADLFVYVINEDESGEAYLLFPSAEFVPSNPLAAGIRHQLPGRREGRDVYWQITSAGGKEKLLIVASPRRLASLESDASALKRPAKDQPVRYARLKPEAVAQDLRGMGGWVTEASTAREFPSRGLFELAEPLREGGEDARGVWIRRIDLDNPGP